MATATATDGEVMTLAEMEARFPDEWVLIIDPAFEDEVSWEILEGRVMFHSPDRDEVHRVTMRLRPWSAATVFMGPVLAPGIDGFAM